MKYTKLAAIVALTLCFIGSATANPALEKLEKTLTKSMPGLNIDSIRTTPMPGIFEIVSGGDVAYVSADGVHMIQGTLYNVPERKNLSEATLGGMRQKLMASIDPSALVVYPAKGKALHTITVFTDPSCPYCKQLHKEVDKLNEMGVTVKYALYARSGNRNLTGRQLQEVACSKDAKRELERFFNSPSQPSEGADCKAATALDHLASLAPKVGLEGTPHIVTDSGLSFSGYRPAADLFKVLETGLK